MLTIRGWGVSGELSTPFKSNMPFVLPSLHYKVAGLKIYIQKLRLFCILVGSCEVGGVGIGHI